MLQLGLKSLAAEKDTLLAKRCVLFGKNMRNTTVRKKGSGFRGTRGNLTGKDTPTRHTYMSWVMMQHRCNNPKRYEYKYYGARGIRVCERWLESFQNFLDDMGLSPTNKHSIDRINVNGNYEPSNCRWATMKEQAHNTRRNHFLTWKGQTKTIGDWGVELGLNEKVLSDRITKLKWSIEKAFTYPQFPKSFKERRAVYKRLSLPIIGKL